MNQQPFDRRAALPGISKAALGRQLHGQFHVRILENDERGIATQFEAFLFVARQRGNLLADIRAAGKADQLNSWIHDDRFDNRAIVSHQNTQHLAGQASLVEQFNEPNRSQRCTLGRFEDDRHSGCNSGGQLVNDLVEGMVERSNSECQLKRLAGGKDLALLALRRDVAGEDLAVVLE